MHGIKISYQDFRNIKDETLELSEGVNVLYGNNAQGKSNMLEGIYFFARGKSFRGAKERELISFGKEFARLSLEFKREKDKYPVTLSAAIPQSGKKLIERGGAKLSSIREMIGDFRAVLFCPAHLSLIGGKPALRRNFLDIALSQLYPAYLDSLSRYNSALRQRNALIKEVQAYKGAPPDMGMFEVYAEQMSHYGADIAKWRMVYMKSLGEHINALFDTMTNGRETPSLSYRSVTLVSEEGTDETAVDQNKLRTALLDNIEKEIRYGATEYGIHKDDITVKLNGKDAKTYASQGQQRSLALSMKLAEGEMSKEIGGETPVFLLDDVLSELDSERRAFILSKLKDRQIIVTSCEPDLFQGGKADRMIHIESGIISDK